MQKKASTDLQPENVNVSASTEDTNAMWRVTCNHSRRAKIQSFSHSVDTYAGLWGQISGSVELLLLETEVKFTVLTLSDFEHWGEKKERKKKRKKKRV